MKYFLSSVLFLGFLLSFQVVSAATTSVIGCTDPAFLYSPITGQKCPTSKVLGAFSDVTDANSTVRLRVTKVECDSEADLPNLGAGDSRNILTWDSVANGPQVTANSGWKWISGSNGKCHFEPDVYFEWATTNSVSPYTTNPGNNLQSGGSGWATFGPSTYSGVAEITVPLDDVNKLYWVREKVTSNYLPFSGSSSNSNSAELYCNFDIHNISSNHGYDNFSKVYFGDVYYNAMQSSPTWYKNNVFDCVAFNAPPVKVLNPSVTVLSPNGGEVYEAGQKITVKWKTENYTGNVAEINLIPADMRYGTGITLVKDIPNNGTYTVTLPSSSDAEYNYYSFGKNFKIEVVIGSSSTTVTRDSSDNLFTISSVVTPSIKVISPNGGETFTAGQIFYPQWEVSGMSTSDMVTIELQDTVSQKEILIGRQQAIDGSVKLVFPTSRDWAEGVRYVLRITAVNSSGQTLVRDFSDNLFTILYTNSTPTVANPVVLGVNVNDATLGATVTSLGNPTMTARGVCFTPAMAMISPSVTSGATCTTSSNTPSNTSIIVYATNLTPNTLYKFRGYATNGVVTGYSEEGFFTTKSTINTTPSFTVLSPNGGEVFTPGQQINVTWQSSNVPETNNKVTVVLQVYKDGEILTASRLATLTNNDGQELVTLPDYIPGLGGAKEGKNFKISVSTTDAIDFSDNFFTISSSSNNCRFAYFAADSYLVNYGDTLTLSWDTLCKNVGIENMDGFPAKNFGSVSSTNVSIYKDTTFTMYVSNDSGCLGTVYSTSTGSKCNYQTRSIIVKVKNISTSCPTAYPTVQVLSPNGGEEYQAGQQVTIKWKSCGMSSTEKVRIDLLVAPFPPNGTNGVNLANTVNDGSETITLPSLSSFNGNPISLGKNFKINIWQSNYSGTSATQDLSDNLFTIKGKTSKSCPTSYPAVQVISPNGGEKYKVGQKIKVKWNPCNVSKNETVRVEIEMGVAANDYSSSWFTSLGDTLNDGEETFTVPAFSNYGELFRVLVSPLDIVGSNGDTSDNSFTINKSNKKFPPGCTSTRGYSLTTGQSCAFFIEVDSICSTNVTAGSPYIAVVSPNGGEVYQAGKDITVKWTSCNISSDELLEINFYGGGTAFGFLRPNGTPNDGTEVISTTGWGSGTDYKIIVGVPRSGFNNSALSTSDQSDRTFSVSTSTLLPGCTSTAGYSQTTGKACNGSKIINTPDPKDFVFYRGLKYGLTGDDVIELQKLLLEKGLYIGPITGYFGPMTVDGVKKFQTQNGFTADGIVGSQTLEILNN
jgi:hypothetical protein